MPHACIGVDVIIGFPGETKEDFLETYQFINELNTLDRALMLLYIDGKSYAEIAEILGITETNTATKINRIKNNLKQKVSGLNK